MIWDNYRSAGIGIHVASNDARPLGERPFTYILVNRDRSVVSARRTIKGQYATPTYREGVDDYHAELAGFVPKGASVKSTKHKALPEGAVLCNELMFLQEGTKLLYQFCRDKQRIPEYTYGVSYRILKTTPLSEEQIPSISETRQFERRKNSWSGPEPRAIPLPL